MAKVLISDKLSPLAATIFKENGINVDVKVGLSADELKKIISNYDGLAIRSATKVTSEILDAATNLKVVGRAGIGVDNVDINAATDKGVVVMNTPFGNSITTAEHAIAMMFAVARKIPQANSSTHQSKWEKSKFMGTELTNKTLGVIGCGNIGSIVAKRAMGLQMQVISYDPFLTQEKADNLGVKKVELDELFQLSDFITLHVPLIDATRNIIRKETIEQMKDGVFIINCARGGLVNEADLLEALNDNKIAGAALDVFEKEPAKDNLLFGNEKVVATPHLGASTHEAQENVALDVAKQISNYLNNGVIENSINIASVSVEDAKKLEPYLKLAAQLGSFVGQITENPIKEIKILYQGDVTKYNTKPVTAVILKNILSCFTTGVNIINSQKIATARGIKIEETDVNTDSDYATHIKLVITTEQQERTIAGTLFGNKPRIVEVNEIMLEADLSSKIIYIKNEDKPGLIGNVGKLLGDNNVNIANFHLGRGKEQQNGAIALISVDNDVSNDNLDIIQNMPGVTQVKYLKF